MSTEITKPLNMEELVRDKVRQLFMDMIPETAIDSLIKKEWDLFTKDTVSYNKTQPSALTKMVQEQIDKYAREHIIPFVQQRLD